MKECGNCRHQKIDNKQSPCKECIESDYPFVKWQEVEREIAVNTKLKAIHLINIERNRQDAKWGEQNHSPQLWTGILGEEYGEYCQAVNETVFNNGEKAKRKGGYDNMIIELTHVAAVAVGAMESLMRARQRGDI